MPTTFLDAAETAAVRHVAESCASRPANTDTVFDLLDELQGLIGCDLVAFNPHGTPERRLRHAQAVASGERQLASPQELAAPQDDEPFWRSYCSCEPCSLPDRVVAPPRRQVALTDRQREVLRLVRLGMANKQVARALGISSGTVRKHLEHAYERLGVQSRTEALRVAAMAEHPPWATQPDRGHGT